MLYKNIETFVSEPGYSELLQMAKPPGKFDIFVLCLY